MGMSSPGSSRSTSGRILRGLRKKACRRAPSALSCFIRRSLERRFWNQTWGAGGGGVVWGGRNTGHGSCRRGGPLHGNLAPTAAPARTIPPTPGLRFSQSLLSREEGIGGRGGPIRCTPTALLLLLLVSDRAEPTRDSGPAAGRALPAARRLQVKND